MTGQEEKKKTCGKKQHVKIDIRKGMSKLICCKFTVGRNYNSTYDNLLARNPGQVFSKEQIYDIVWKEPYSGDYNIVMSHIRNIREKIDDNPGKPVYIQTVWGVGYRFNQNMSSGL